MSQRYRIRKPLPKKPMRRPVVDQRMLDKVIPVMALDGQVIFEGTEAEWRQWVDQRRRAGEFALPINDEDL